ncbi:MAG: hypothetical protein AAFQ98_04765 [Bacteroidota bacterium]
MKKLLSLTALAVFLVATAFSPASEVSESSEALFSCTAPGTPRTPTFNTDGQNFINATTSANLFDPPGVQYEWQVVNGFIISGQGTLNISIGPDCPSPNTISVRVRAYTTGSGGSICYSGWSSYGNLSWSGPCFF